MHIKYKISIKYHFRVIDNATKMIYNIFIFIQCLIILTIHNFSLIKYLRVTTNCYNSAVGYYFLHGFNFIIWFIKFFNKVDT